MPELTLEFEVFCSCGEGLCRLTSTGTTGGRGMPFITVEPCPKCVENARSEGYEEGHCIGHDECFEIYVGGDV